MEAGFVPPFSGEQPAGGLAQVARVGRAAEAGERGDEEGAEALVVDGADPNVGGDPQAVFVYGQARGRKQMPSKPSRAALTAGSL